MQHSAEQLLVTYQALVDAKDIEGLDAIITDDVELVRQDGTRTGREAFLDLYRTFAASDVEIATHTVSNVRVAELGPQRYGVDSCFVAYTTHTSGEARMVWGRYHHLMVDEDGTWLIAAKHIRIARTVVLGAGMTFDPGRDSFSPARPHTPAQSPAHKEYAMGSLEDRLRRVEDRLDITDLVQLYGYVMDERDLDGLPRLFTSDAELHSEDGVFKAIGLDAIRETYAGRYAALGPTYHYAHGVIVRFDDSDPDVAYGLVNGNAEVVREGTTMVVALRYKDTYRRTDEGWRFQVRTMSYMYYMPLAEFDEGLKSVDRTRAYGDRRPADWPSVLHGGDLDWLRAHYS